MTKTLNTKFEIVAWDESTYRELADGSKFTKADVSLKSADDLIATYEAIMFYRPNGTSSYVNLMHVTGNLDGEQGSFVLQGEGSWDGKSAHGTCAIVEGSGTGDFVNLRGTAESTSTHDDYPFMPLVLRYELD